MSNRITKDVMVFNLRNKLKNLIYWSTIKIKSNLFKKKNLMPCSVNLLIVGDIKYVPFARDCIKSFSLFQPKSSFNLYVDNITHEECERFLQKISKRNTVKFVNISDTFANWQEAKLNVILSQSESDEIFMDADLRWYGPLPKMDGVQFFVDEGPLRSSEVFKKILEANLDLEQNAHMLNVSYVCFNNVKIASSTIQKIANTCKNYDALIASAKLNEEEISQVERLKEQFSISVFASEISGDIQVLKNIDRRADKSNLVSSCYLGSTGLGF